MSDEQVDSSSQGINLHAQKDLSELVSGNYHLEVVRDADTLIVDGDQISVAELQSSIVAGKALSFECGESLLLITQDQVLIRTQRVNFSTVGGTVSYLARQGDFHHCPKTNSSDQSHVGGPIIAGSPNVLIDGKPAARMGDPLVCQHGPTDHIAQGNHTLLINGEPAAHVGHKTVHGGTIQQGSPTAGGGMHLSLSGGNTVAPTMSQSHWGFLLEQHKFGHQL